MKILNAVDFNLQTCRTELAEFGVLLASKAELSEANDILPFFKVRRQLCLLLGVFNSRIGWADRVADEFDIFGDFACDLAVGQWDRRAYCFVEFEDGRENSVFHRQGAKATTEWARRFEHGYSQIIDWLFKLDDRNKSDDFVARFGGRAIDYEAILVIGRDQFVSVGDRLRMEWRNQKIVINSLRVHCITFDRLFLELSARLNLFAGVQTFAPSSSNPAPTTDEASP